VKITELISLIVSQFCQKEIINVMQAKLDQERTALAQENQRRVEVEKDLDELKLNTLRSQMTPYFLRSALTVISNLAAVEDALQTNEVISTLAKFISSFMQVSKSIDFIEDEMKVVEHYLFIQKARLGEMLEYSVSVPEDMRLQRIPSMLIFPFVERAVNCGISLKQGKGKITVSSEYEGDYVVIRVTDDGPGFTKKDLEALFTKQRREMQDISDNIGIQVSQQRMEHYFGKTNSVKIDATRGKGTVCTIRFPRSFDEEAT